MDPREEQRLLQWYEEADSDVPLSESGDDSEPEPYSDDGMVTGDLDYIPSDSCGSESDRDRQSVHDQETGGGISEGEDSNQDDPTQEENNSHAESEDSEDDVWEEVYSDIPNFNIDVAQSGIKIDGIGNMSPVEVFRQIWNDEVMSCLVACTNLYGTNLGNTVRPKTRNSRSREFKPVTVEEMEKFLGLCLLQSMVKIPVIQ